MNALRTAGRLIWAAAWRAEALHLAMFIVAPVLAALGKLAVAFAFPLLLIIGPGDPMLYVKRGTEHLRQPGCWLALAPCMYAVRSVEGAPKMPESRDLPDTAASEYDDRLSFSLPHVITWRHVWFFAWASWFILYVVRRERR